MDIDAMAGALKNGIEANSTNAPQMSIDPKTQAVSVVGDPNEIKVTPRTYKLIFSYPEDEITEEDKTKMVPSETAEGEYEATVTYENRRVRPINRTKISMYVGNIFNDIGLFQDDGSYDSETITRQSTELFVQHVDKIAEMAEMVLEVPHEQMKYVRSDCLVDFFLTMLQSEPNVIKEAASFLGASSRQRLAKIAKEASEISKPQNTPQS